MVLIIMASTKSSKARNNALNHSIVPLSSWRRLWEQKRCNNHKNIVIGNNIIMNSKRIWDSEELSALKRYSQESQIPYIAMQIC
jgi:hypothetical protein